jgi:cytochrome c-type biogenesis protein
MVGWAGLAGAFLAGLLSFASPCVLPLTPIYIAQLVGPGIWQLSSAAREERLRIRRVAFTTALAFVGGFSLAFIALGATASELGSLLAAHATLLRQFGGIVLIALGVFITGLLPLPWLGRTQRIPLRMGKPGYATSFVVGMIFALGWTPCVGPILAGILTLAAQGGTLRAGVLLLVVYSLGLSLPFLALGLAFDRLTPLLGRLRRWSRLIEVLTGLLLVLMGVMILMNWLLVVNSWIPVPMWLT